MKKYFIGLIFILFSSCAHKTYTLFFEKEDISRPVTLNANDFWVLKLDSIKIVNYYKILEIDRSLKKMNRDDGNFSVSYSLISHMRHGLNDTLYADLFFRYWKIGNVNYEDTSERLKLKLFPFLNR